MTSFDIITVASIIFTVIVIVKILLAMKDGKLTKGEYRGIIKTVAWLAVFFFIAFSLRGYNSYRQLNILEKPLIQPIASGVTAEIPFTSICREHACSWLNEGSLEPSGVFPNLDEVKQICVLDYLCTHDRLPHTSSQIWKCLQTNGYVWSALFEILNQGVFWLLGILILFELVFDTFSLFS